MSIETVDLIGCTLLICVAVGVGAIDISRNLDAQTAALQQIAASLQGKPPVQVTAVVDLGAGAKQTLEDALGPETKHRGVK